MDKMVEIARFQYPADAYTLMGLLKSEGIECYLRNETTATLLSYIDVGGARVEILEKDVPRAMEVMEEGGYPLPKENESPESLVHTTGWMNKVPGLRNLSFNAQIIVMVILVIAVLSLFLLVGYQLSTNN